MSQTVILETARLRLETWGSSAAAELLDMHADPHVARYLDPQGRVYDETETRRRLHQWQEEYRKTGLGKQRLVRKLDGIFVGRAGFSLFHGDTPEIGYSLARPYWGQGYASEIAAALRDWVFNVYAARSFIGFAHVDNLGSRRVLEKIGMRPTHQASVKDMPHQFYALERAA
jgi:RimJ/RimL family protein N-acetyltransferase